MIGREVIFPLVNPPPIQQHFVRVLASFTDINPEPTGVNLGSGLSSESDPFLQPHIKAKAVRTNIMQAKDLLLLIVGLTLYIN